jgi:hypothetical protein
MESNWEEVIESFDELGLKKDLLRGKYNINQVYMVMVLKNPHLFNKKLFYQSLKERIL